MRNDQRELMDARHTLDRIGLTFSPRLRGERNWPHSLRPVSTDRPDFRNARTVVPSIRKIGLVFERSINVRKGTASTA